MRTTLRMLWRRPGFFTLATNTLALGITATTVVFSFAYGVLLSPLPYVNAKRLMLLWEFDRAARSDPGEDFGPVTTVPQGDLIAWQRQTRTMESLDALTFGFYSLTQGASPTEVLGGRVTPGFFGTLGVRPVLGRTFAPGDPDDVVVLGYSLWQSQYGADRSIVGRQILLGDGRYTVLGVLPPQFFFYMREFALWTPLKLLPGGRRQVMGVGLLRRGVMESQAQAEFDAIAGQLARQAPAENRSLGARVIGVREQYSRFYRPMLGVLLLSVGFLLLIACANVASLLLARAAERQREMAIRTALGATRRQIVGQLLMESLTLALCAGAVSVAAALFLVPLARTLLPMKLPIPLPGVEAIAISLPVLLFSCAVSVVTVLLFGLAPALRSAAITLGARSTPAGFAQRRYLDAIVVVELALAVLLLTGAGLAMRSVYALYRGTGFQTDHMLTLRTPTAGLTPQRRVRLYQDVIDSVHALPGVRDVAAAYNNPGGPSSRSAVFAAGGSTDPKDAAHAAVNQVSSEFFKALDIPIVAGRTFSQRDSAESPNVAILSTSLARTLFGSADPLGRQVRIGGQAPERWFTVAGIAGDVRPMLSEAPEPTMYCPVTQDPPGAIGFLIHTAGAPLDLAPAVEKKIWEIRPGQPVTYLGTLEGDMDQQGFRQRLSAIGLGWFAAFGLALAAVGIYGLLAYVVKQRLHEFGVRLAIGATREDLIALVLRRGAALIGTGLLLGVMASLALTRLLKSVLYGVQPIDVPTYAGAAALLAAIGLAACYLPARKAGSVDPMTVLRSE